MNIGIIGATGTIGQRILNEALSRGHNVTAFAREESRIPAEKGKVTWEVADVLDADSLAWAIGGQDVVISSYGPGQARDPQTIVAAAHALLKAMEKHPGTRVIFVGGAGSLEVKPGLQLVDSGAIPDAYKAVVLAHRDALNVFRQAPGKKWTFFSPAGFISPGERTGKFRLGGDQLIVGEDGQSRISCEDYAVAMLDEAEKGQFIGKRFTVGY